MAAGNGELTGKAAILAAVNGGSGEKGTRKIVIYAPVVKGKKGRHEAVFDELRRKGFARVRVDGTVYPIEEAPDLDKKKSHDIDVVVDRLVLPCDRTRLTDSVELALKTGGGILRVEPPDAADGGQTFSELNACPDCGISFEELKPRSRMRSVWFFPFTAM